MNLLKRAFTALLILLLFNLYLPPLTFAEQEPTQSPIKIRATPEQKIPEVEEKKGSAWTWLILIALVGGVAAAAGGGGGGDEGGNETPETTGNYTISW